MIYLIGGTPRSGKSILSRKLSRKLNVPYISTDNIIPIVNPYFKKHTRDKIFPLNLISISELLEKYSGKDMLSFDLTEAKAIWPGTKQLIYHLIECKMDYIIEGVHLLPHLVKEFKHNHNIKILFLAKFDEEKIYKGFFKNLNNSDWIIEHAKDDDTIRSAAKSLSVYGVYFKKEIKKHNFELINTEYYFSRQINKAVFFLQVTK